MDLMAVKGVVDVLEAYRGDIVACLGTVAVVVLIVVVKRRVVGGRVVEPLRTLEPAQMALVLGDDDRALLSSIAALRMDGAVSAADDGTLCRFGPVPPASTRLDRAVYERLAEEQPSLAQLQSRWQITTVIGAERDRLRRAGLFHRFHGSSELGPGASIAMLVTLLGGVCGIVGLHDFAPTFAKVGAWVLPFGIVLLGSYIGTLPARERTPLGERTAERLRQELAHLRPGRAAALSGNDAATVRLAVAAFGGAALWSVDPDFAERLGVPGHPRRTANPDRREGEPELEVELDLGMITDGGVDLRPQLHRIGTARSETPDDRPRRDLSTGHVHNGHHTSGHDHDGPSEADAPHGGADHSGSDHGGSDSGD